MSISYLKYHPWSDWTRDERFFCSVLYNHAIKDKSKFAKWVCMTANLNLPIEGPWDVGYEVSFYRDYLWQQRKRAADPNVSNQRAFDLCLFSDHALVIIEAKVFEPFKSKQNDEFAKDKKRITELPGLEHVQVRLVSLASSIYYKNQTERGSATTLSMFDGRLTWAQAAEFYKDPLLDQADRTYKMKPAMVKVS